MLNPYESPTTAPSARPPLWPCAAVLWLLGLAPGVLVALGVVPLDALATELPIAAGVVLFCGCPLIGFGLLGLGCAMRSWRLAGAGVAVLGVAGVVSLVVG